ncbi:MAG: hypothetical protein WCJ26_09945 [bacterium]
MKRVILIIIFSFIAKLLLPSTLVIPTSGTPTGNQPQPFGMSYAYERTASLYSTGLTAPVLITSLGWYVGTANAVVCPVKIYIKNTTSTSLNSISWASMKSGATLVFYGILSFPVSGLKIIDIADFVTTGTSTKIIVLCEANYGGSVGASTFPSFDYYSTSSTAGTHEFWQGDDSTALNSQPGVITLGPANYPCRPKIQLTYTTITTGNTIPPSGFMANAFSSSQINLNWVKNSANDNVMVAYNTVNSFGTPSGTYATGNAISGGGTVIYNGSGTTFSHASGLSPSTTYYYKAWSVQSPTPTYSTGTSSSSTTFCVNLSNFPDITDFELASFPPECWSLAGIPVTRASAVSGYAVGTAASIFDFLSIVSGNFDLISPVLNLAALSSPVVTFDHAYATWDTQVDRLELWSSVDNGASYTLLTTLLGGLSGPLNTGGATTSPFVPTSSQWATKNYGLPAGTNKIMFRGISYHGNNLYIDNITFQEDMILWNGSISTDWNNPANWTPAAVPDGTKSIRIPTGTLNSPTRNTDMIIGTGKTLTISPGARLILNGNLTIL